MDRITKKLESRGAKEMTIRDRKATLYLGIVTELIIITLIMTFVGIMWLKLAISIYLLITLIITMIIIETDKIDPPDFLFVAIVTIHLFFFILSIWLIIEITPYRGDNPMKLRKEKLRKLIRKSKFEKLKFWKN